MSSSKRRSRICKLPSCICILAAADLLLTSIRLINFTHANKNPGFVKCWLGLRGGAIHVPVTVACLIYHSINSKITLLLYILRSLFAVALIIQRWRYPKCVFLTWLTSQFTELSMQLYTWIQVGFWHMDPYAVLQFIFKVFIVYMFMNQKNVQCCRENFGGDRRSSRESLVVRVDDV